MSDTITLRRDGIEATVRVGDIVPMTDGTTRVVVQIDPHHGDCPVALESEDWLAGQWHDKDGGTFEGPAIDIAKLAEQQAALARPAAVPADIAAIEEAAYKRGWNDREDDLIAGIERIMPPEHRQPAVPAEAIRALVERWQALARNADEGVKDAEPGGMTSFILSSAAGTFRDCAADLLKLLEAHNG